MQSVGLLHSPSHDFSAIPFGRATPESSEADNELEQLRFGSKPAGWRTDSEISTQASHGYGRELIPWDASSEGGQVLDATLEESAKENAFQGNQFLVNQELFGVVSTFKDDLSQYTTPLDISAVPPAIREKATRLAREIERNRKKNSDPEDVCIDNDEDEEGLWSAVQRDIRDTESKSKTSKSHGAEKMLPAATMRGTFVHVDGVGIVDECTAQSMPWLFQQPAWEQPSYACTAVGQWHGNQVLTTVQVATETETVAYTEPFLPSGTEVMIEGLVKAPAFNGLHGIVDSFDYDSGRYNVRLQACAKENQLAKIKIENLRWVMLAGQPLPGYQ